MAALGRLCDGVGGVAGQRGRRKKRVGNRKGSSWERTPRPRRCGFPPHMTSDEVDGYMYGMTQRLETGTAGAELQGGAVNRSHTQREGGGPIRKGAPSLSSGGEHRERRDDVGIARTGKIVDVDTK